jgi:hypothetical protein
MKSFRPKPKILWAFDGRKDVRSLQDQTAEEIG